MREHATTIAGAVTYWSLAEWTNVDRAMEGLKALGLEDFAPAPPSPLVAMRRALQDVFRDRKFLVRSLKGGDRYAVVREEHVGRDDLEYHAELKAQVIKEADGGSTVHVTPPDHPASAAVLDTYAVHRRRVPSHSVGQSLANIARHLNGVRLRESGGVFWLPQEPLDRWAAASDAMEASSETGNTIVYRLQTVIDDRAVAAVSDAITKDVEDCVTEIRAKVSEQERKGALERRAKEAADLEHRIATYEKILGMTLDTLRAKQQEAEREASMAVLAAMGGGE